MRLVPLLIVCGCASSQPWAPPGEIPLTIRRSASGSVRFSAEVRIGNSDPFEAMVDTGSSGLRVLPGVIDDRAFESTTDVLVAASFHSGLALQGTMATGTVTLGGMTTPAIPIMRVDQIGCTAAVPDCDAAGQDIADYQMFGHYRAMLGLGMRSSPTSAGIGNPIVQLEGQPAFVIHAPAFDGSEDGAIEIAPSDTSAFRTVSLPTLATGVPLDDGSPAWDDRTVPACVTDSSATYCCGAILDTGCPETKIEWSGYTGPAVTWPPATTVEISVGPLDDDAFSVGATPTPGIDEVILEPQTGTSMINLGTTIFFRGDVLFDQASGVIGFAKG